MTKIKFAVLQTYNVHLEYISQPIVRIALLPQMISPSLLRYHKSSAVKGGNAFSEEPNTFLSNQKARFKALHLRVFTEIAEVVYERDTSSSGEQPATITR